MSDPIALVILGLAVLAGLGWMLYIHHKIEVDRLRTTEQLAEIFKEALEEWLKSKR